MWLVVLALSTWGVINMHYITNSINKDIDEIPTLRIYNRFYELWKNPPFKTNLKIHVFNYTNVEEFLNGKDDKLKVRDVGPYVYQEESSKTNLNFSENDREVTYQVTEI